MTTSIVSKNKVFILLAQGFEEVPTVYCLGRMRKASLPVALVGLSSGLVTGMFGLTIRPDHSLDQVQSDEAGRLVLIPGGRQCTTLLLADPRVHQLLECTLTMNGFVATTVGATAVISQTLTLLANSQKNFLPQGDMSLGKFASFLIDAATK